MDQSGEQVSPSKTVRLLSDLGFIVAVFRLYRSHLFGFPSCIITKNLDT